MKIRKNLSDEDMLKGYEEEVSFENAVYGDEPVKNKKIKYPLIVFLSILILLIGISRIYLGAHYATDVIGGWIIGAVYLAFFIKYGYKKIVKKSKKTF